MADARTLADRGIEVERIPGSSRAVSEILAQFAADSIALESRRNELLCEHGEQWYGYHGGKVYSAVRLEDLLEDLRAAGVYPGRVPVRFLSERRVLHEHLT